MGTLYYLAYGSNLHPMRLRQRVESARLITPVELPQHRLTFHKHSVDGSAKCNLVHTGDSNDIAYGAIYQIAEEHKDVLDWYEGTGFGYVDTLLNVTHHDKQFACLTYLATQSHIVDHLHPYHWYKELVLHGARHHKFPSEYIESIAAVDSIQDQDKERRSENEALIERITSLVKA